MKKFSCSSTYLLFWLCLFLLSSSGLYAQNSAIIQERFQLESTFGAKEVYSFEVKRSGSINITAKWIGKADRLALILNGPGQVGYYDRQDGTSPLNITYQVTPTLLAKGTKWSVSIVNFGRKGGAAGVIKIEYPVEFIRLDLEDLQIDPQQPEVIDDLSPAVENDSQTSQETGITRSILEDGTVELRYPDGTVKLITQGGYTIIHPDGTTSMVLAINKPPTTPPELPKDEKISAYLEWQTESLLHLIKEMLNYEEESIENFLNHEREVAQNVYQKMYIRTSFINMLLSN